MYKTLLLLLFFILKINFVFCGQLKELTLEECVHLALKNNNLLKASKLNINYNQTKVELARAANKPNLNLAIYDYLSILAEWEEVTKIK